MKIYNNVPPIITYMRHACPQLRFLLLAAKTSSCIGPVAGDWERFRRLELHNIWAPYDDLVIHYPQLRHLILKGKPRDTLKGNLPHLQLETLRLITEETVPW